MPILNMIAQGSGGGGNIGEPLNLTVTTSGLNATITWEDNEIGTIPPTTFQKSELVRKIGSAPTSPSDGVLVVTETVKDTYKTTGYVDQGLTNGETYYYRVFSYSDLGGISYCDAVSVTPSGWQPGVDTLVYMPLDSINTNSDVLGHTTTIGGTVRFGTYGGIDCADLTSRGNISITPFALGNSYTILARANNVNGVYYDGGRVVDLGNPRVGIAYRSPEGYYTYENNDYFGVTTQNAWFLTAVVVTGSTGVGYLKGNGVDDTSALVSCFNSGTPTAFNIGNEYNNGADRYFLGYISNVIVEDKARTAQEISDYYDLTKGNYGIS